MLPEEELDHDSDDDDSIRDAVKVLAALVTRSEPVSAASVAMQTSIPVVYVDAMIHSLLATGFVEEVPGGVGVRVRPGFF